MTSFKRRALLSVFDKTGIIGLAQALTKHNWEIISTGGTRKVLMEAGIPVIDIATVSRNPEAFGGRMKTISFNIESAILYDRERDAREADLLGIQPIDMVVCNLYPFGDVLKKGGDMDELIENIDIGGPTMIRAAAKNWKYVAAVTNPGQYPFIIQDLENDGKIGVYRRELMEAAFNLTADYDAMIAQAFDPNTKRFVFDGRVPLRYGENSHQDAYFYRQRGARNSLYDAEVLHGKELSFNNILDIQAALDAIREAPEDKYTCSVVKHNNSCGLAEGPDTGNSQREILELAWAGDPISAFGSIIAFNQIVGLDTVEFFELESKQKRKFFEVIAAPDYDPLALEYLKQSKNLRIVKYDVTKMKVGRDYRFMNGSLLEQTPDDEIKSKLDLATKKGYDTTENPLIDFGLRAIKNVKSNAILLVRRVPTLSVEDLNADLMEYAFNRVLQLDENNQEEIDRLNQAANHLTFPMDGVEYKEARRYLESQYDSEYSYQLLGMGAGQPNRIISTQLAIEKARANDPEFDLGDCWMISDAFFPFPDCVEYAHKHGVRKIVQPGGSMRDKQVIDKCNELGVTMVFTGLRHFRH